MKEKFKLKNGNILYIIQDDQPIDPRSDDNLGTMICWHRRYSLGDTKKSKEFADTESLFCELAGMPHSDEVEGLNTKEEFKEYFEKVSDKAHENAIILPLRLFDHSGLSMSVGSGAHEFDPGGWDSGQIGWIYITREKIAEEFGKHGGRTDEEIISYLEGEVALYDQYLTGDCYGFQLMKVVKFEKKNLGTGEVTIIEEEEHVDSCWGFFGTNFKENGLYEAVGITQEDIIEEVNA